MPGPQLARRHLRLPLARVHDDLRLALVGVVGVGVADAAGELRAGLDQLAALASDVGLGDPHQPLRGVLLGRELRLVRRERATEQPDGARAQLGGGVDALEQLAVVAHHEQHARPLRDGVVEQLARAAVQVVGRLVEQRHREAPHEQPRQPGEHRLAAGERVGRAGRGRWAARSGRAPRPRVPRCPRRRRRRRSRTRRPPPPRAAPAAAAATPSRSATVRSASQGDGLRRGSRPARPTRTRARRGPQLTGDQPQQGGLAGPVGADQPGATGAERDVEAGQHDGRRRARRRTGRNRRWQEQAQDTSRIDDGQDRGVSSPRVNRKGRVVRGGNRLSVYVTREPDQLPGRAPARLMFALRADNASVVSMARDRVAAWLDRHRWPAEESHDIVYAVSEAVTQRLRARLRPAGGGHRGDHRPRRAPDRGDAAGAGRR